MSYSYKTERPFIFTEEGQVQFLAVRDRVQHLIKTAGAFRMDRAIEKQSGDSWHLLACVDRLVELKEIHELTPPNSCAGQHRVFTNFDRL